MAKAKMPKFAVYCVDSEGPYFFGSVTSKTALKELIRDAKKFVTAPAFGDVQEGESVQVFELTPIP